VEGESGTAAIAEELGSGAVGTSGLKLSLINGPLLSWDSVRISLRNRKASAMLTYLALSDTGQEKRERLAGLLWSESGEANARTALRQTLHEARTALEGVGCTALVADRTSIALRPDCVTIDITEFEAAISDFRLPDALARVPNLSEGMLSGLDDLDPAFQPWLIGQREAAHRRLLSALEAAYGAAGVSLRVRRRFADAALLLDPTHEDACRTVMRCAAASGETGAALRAYDALYRLLGDEYDMEPSVATQSLVADIKRGLLEQPASAAGPLPTERVWPEIASGVPRVAVLPFRALGPDPIPAYLTEGIAEDMVCSLSGLREPVVISSNSTRRFAAVPADLDAIGRDLDVHYVVSGLLRQSGPMMRLSVELADARSRAVIWARAYDVEGTSLFAVQDSIVAQIVNTLAPRVHEAELRWALGTRRPEGLGAYHKVLQARSLTFQLAPEPFEQAGELLQSAVAIEPGYAAAHAALAGWYSLRMGQGWSPDPVADMRALESAATTAISLDAGSARALALLGHSRTILERRYPDALDLFGRALEAAPNDAEAWLWSSPSFCYLGQGEEAIRRAERARSLSPQDQFIFRTYHFLCLAHYAARSYKEAADWGMRSVQENPRYTSGLRATIAALIATGRRQDAAELALAVLDAQPGYRVGDVDRLPFHDAGDRVLFGRRLIEAGLPE
jgi:DNA-binding SARP family transcriptional activator/TolB-like protein